MSALWHVLLRVLLSKVKEKDCTSVHDFEKAKRDKVQARIRAIGRTENGTIYVALSAYKWKSVE